MPAPGFFNIAERRLPQDGRTRRAVRGTEIDVRVSVIPTIHGESVVLRILDRSLLALDFARLGFDAVIPDSSGAAGASRARQTRCR